MLTEFGNPDILGSSFCLLMRNELAQTFGWTPDEFREFCVDQVLDGNKEGLQAQREATASELRLLLEREKDLIRFPAPFIGSLPEGGAFQEGGSFREQLVQIVLDTSTPPEAKQGKVAQLVSQVRALLEGQIKDIDTVLKASRGFRGANQDHLLKTLKPEHFLDDPSDYEQRRVLYPQGLQLSEAPFVVEGQSLLSPQLQALKGNPDARRRLRTLFTEKIEGDGWIIEPPKHSQVEVTDEDRIAVFGRDNIADLGDQLLVTAYLARNWGGYDVAEVLCGMQTESRATHEVDLTEAARNRDVVCAATFKNCALREKRGDIVAELPEDFEKEAFRTAVDRGDDRSSHSYPARDVTGHPRDLKTGQVYTVQSISPGLKQVTLVRHTNPDMAPIRLSFATFADRFEQVSISKAWVNPTRP